MGNCCQAQSIYDSSEVRRCSPHSSSQKNETAVAKVSSKTLSPKNAPRHPTYLTLQCSNNRSIVMNATFWRDMNDAITAIAFALNIRTHQTIRLEIWDNETAKYIYPTSVLQLISQFKAL